MAWLFRRLWATPPPWWEKWHMPELLMFLLFLLPVKACQLGWDYYAARRAAARVAAVLEPLNPWRRQVGLAPVTAALPDRFSSPDSIVHLSEPYPAPPRYRPYVSAKHVCFAEGRVRWEVDVLFWPAAQRRPEDKQARLERTYTAGRVPALRFELEDGSGTRSLTRAEADSVLAYWKAQGARDSLAAVQR